jgi:hypothetical protein
LKRSLSRWIFASSSAMRASRSALRFCSSASGVVEDAVAPSLSFISITGARGGSGDGSRRLQPKSDDANREMIARGFIDEHTNDQRCFSRTTVNRRRILGRLLGVKGVVAAAR